MTIPFLPQAKRGGSRLRLSLILCFCLWGAARAQPRAEDSLRVERLASLGRLWGKIEFAHPWLAERGVDWDSALVATIPLVEAARTPAELAAACNRLLGALDDPASRAELTGAPRPGVERAPLPPESWLRVEGKVLVVEAVEIARGLAADTSGQAELLRRLRESAPACRGVLLDLRTHGRLDSSGGGEGRRLDLFLRAALGDLLHGPLPLGALRQLEHDGFVDQAGSGSGGYSSQFSLSRPQPLPGRNPNPTPPLLCLMDQGTTLTSDLLCGLQEGAGARIWLEGPAAPDLDAVVLPLSLSPEVLVWVRVADLVRPDGGLGFEPDRRLEPAADAAVARKAAIKALRRGLQRATPQPARSPTAWRESGPALDPPFPDREHRLLALFRFWNIIQHFFPYRHLLDEPWEIQLARHIPLFEACRDAADYQLALRWLAAHTRDSHVFISGASAAAERLGTWFPPLVVRLVQGELLVTEVLEDSLGIKSGEVLELVDGRNLDELKAWSEQWVACSTPQALDAQLPFYALRGQRDSEIRLTLRTAGGERRERSLRRSSDGSEPRRQRPPRATPVYGLLEEGVGYADLGRLLPAQVDSLFAVLGKAPALILDMRGYPNGTAWELAPRLAKRDQPLAALFSRPLLRGLDLAYWDDSEERHSFEQRLAPCRGTAYGGHVYMLIDESAISQAEHTCLFVEAATDVTFVGLPTVGANGDVTSFRLPGGLGARFSGHDVRHGDGRRLQRLGIQPHVRVEPTAAGVLEGRDEILEVALELARGTAP